jgi:predicted nucleic acid-binding protein
MLGELLLDTGALVSLLDRSQTHHLKCRRAFADWGDPVVSTEAVLIEATHLLSNVQGGRAACVDFFLSGGALLVPSSTTSLQRVRELLDKYADLPMDYADATLVALAEELDCTSVFTTDRTDFSVYRVKSRRPFRIVPSDRVGQTIIPSRKATKEESIAQPLMIRFVMIVGPFPRACRTSS